MRNTTSFLLIIAFCLGLNAQMYFPPTDSEDWENLDPAELDYCQDRIDSLYQFLDERDTDSFILLKDGRIVLEQYFGTYTQDSIHYWASAGKSLTAMLIGCAQADGLLNIEDPTSDFLGQGWTSATPEQEAEIRIRHQLSMCTGLDDGILDQNCLDPECLEYLAEPETRWAYYNAPYRLLLDVLEEVSGQNISVYTFLRIGQRIGMDGFWFDRVRYGKARDMARYGLLALNEGVWDTDTILSDQDYFSDMVNPSQDLNNAYGYLWWLNGSEDYMLPQTQFVFDGPLTASAPADMYAALGRDDQKIYVVPSEGMVVVRQGGPAGEIFLGPSSFDNQLWEQINALVCEPDGLSEFMAEESALTVYPNPSSDWIRVVIPQALASPSAVQCLEVFDLTGRMVRAVFAPIAEVAEGEIAVDLSGLPAGLYSIQLRTDAKLYTGRVLMD